MRRLLLAVALLTGCSSVQSTSTLQSGSHHLRVVTTVAPITDIVRTVAGDAVDVHGIIPEGTDSHTFEPAPGDAVVLSQADLVLVNGLHLETP
ncbi:MAG TPA: zinc ABC transporter substrate-binding protein, partial [Candidatus Xenobia bacterium]